MTSIRFTLGSKVEFYGDGDICELIRNYTLRGVYFIEYRSLKNGKRYKSRRTELIELYNDGDLKLVY